MAAVRRQVDETHGADIRQCMTTRSGASYRRTTDMMSNPREREERQGNAGVSDLVRLLLEDRRRREETRRREGELAAERARREEELAAERRRREEEARQHSNRIKEQMDMIRNLVESSQTAVAPSGDGGRTVEGHGAVREKLVLTKLSNHDIEAFLTTFERLMTVYGVGEDRWAIKLAPQLTGRAL